MNNDWQMLSDMIGSKDFYISKVTIKENDVSIEGKFELPPLAKLSYDDQVFVAEFIRSHGSIKQMEQAFGVSYPTIKLRLNKICEKIQFVEIKTIPNKNDVLDMLEAGTITPKEAIERLKKQ